MSAIVKDYGSVVREIRTDIVVTSALPLTGSTGNAVSCSALWDTGANATVVSERVATALGLAPVGMVTVHTANGPYDTPIYAIDVMLPNNVMGEGDQSDRIRSPNLRRIDRDGHNKPWRHACHECTKYKVRVSTSVERCANVGIIKPCTRHALQYRPESCIDMCLRNSDKVGDDFGFVRVVRKAIGDRP